MLCASIYPCPCLILLFSLGCFFTFLIYENPCQISRQCLNAVSSVHPFLISKIKINLQYRWATRFMTPLGEILCLPFLWLAHLVGFCFSQVSAQNNWKHVFWGKSISVSRQALSVEMVYDEKKEKHRETSQFPYYCLDTIMLTIKESACNFKHWFNIVTWIVLFLKLNWCFVSHNLICHFFSISAFSVSQRE